MRLRAGTDGPRIRVFEKLPPTCLGLATYLGLPTHLGRVGKSFRIDARQGDAGSFANPGVTVVLLRLLERGDGILGLFAKPAKSDAGMVADVPVSWLRASINAGTTFAASPCGKLRSAISPSPLPDFRSAINSSVDFRWLQPPHASKPSNRTRPVCTHTQVPSE